MECSFRAELNEHRYYVLNPTGRLNIRGHPIVPLYVVQLYIQSYCVQQYCTKYMSYLLFSIFSHYSHLVLSTTNLPVLFIFFICSISVTVSDLRTWGESLSRPYIHE